MISFILFFDKTLPHPLLIPILQRSIKFKIWQFLSLCIQHIYVFFWILHIYIYIITDYIYLSGLKIIFISYLDGTSWTVLNTVPKPLIITRDWYKDYDTIRKQSRSGVLLVLVHDRGKTSTPLTPTLHHV